jgi:hypothetical protein
MYEQYLVELDFFFVSLLTEVTRKAVPWLGLVRHMPGIGNRLIDVGFVVDQVSGGEVCLRVLQFTSVSIISLMCHTLSFLPAGVSS